MARASSRSSPASRWGIQVAGSVQSTSLLGSAAQFQESRLQTGHLLPQATGPHPQKMANLRVHREVGDANPHLGIFARRAGLFISGPGDGGDVGLAEPSLHPSQGEATSGHSSPLPSVFSIVPPFFAIAAHPAFDLQVLERSVCLPSPGNVQFPNPLLLPPAPGFDADMQHRHVADEQGLWSAGPTAKVRGQFERVLLPVGRKNPADGQGFLCAPAGLAMESCIPKLLSSQPLEYLIPFLPQSRRHGLSLFVLGDL